MNTYYASDILLGAGESAKNIQTKSPAPMEVLLQGGSWEHCCPRGQAVHARGQPSHQLPASKAEVMAASKAGRRMSSCDDKVTSKRESLELHFAIRKPLVTVAF